MDDTGTEADADMFAREARRLAKNNAPSEIGQSERAGGSGRATADDKHFGFELRINGPFRRRHGAASDFPQMSASNKAAARNAASLFEFASRPAARSHLMVAAATAEVTRPATGAW